MANSKDFIVKNGIQAGANSSISGTLAAGNTSITGTLSTTGNTAIIGNLTVDTVTAGAWNGSVIAGQYGGTGVNNSGKTITLGGNISTANSFTISGNFATTLTATAATNVTLPTTGTLATRTGTETLTNKTLTSPTINSGALSGTFTGSPLFSGTINANSMIIVDTGTGVYTDGFTLRSGTIAAGNPGLYLKKIGATAFNINSWNGTTNEGSLTLTFPEGISTSANLSVGSNLTVTGNTNIDSGTFYVDASNNLTLIGSTVGYPSRYSGGTIAGDTTNADFQVHGTGVYGLKGSFVHWASGTLGARIQLGKSKGAKGTHTIVATGDTLGEMQFAGSDGIDFVIGASIRADVEGTPVANNITAGITFRTANTGSGSNVYERMRVSSNGNIGIGTSTPTSKLSVLGTVDIVGNTSIQGNTSITGDMTVGGNLTINGTTTTINSTTISVDDKNIELGSIATANNTTADGGGITLKGTTDKTLNWVNATGAWTSSEDFNLLTGKVYEINGTTVLSSTALGSGVTGSNLTSVGTIGTGVWQGTVVAGQYGGTGVNNTGRTITLGGNISTANSFTTSGNFSINVVATAATSVTLPTAGTLAVVNTGLNQFASTTSSQLAGVISDKTGSGNLVFSSAATLTGTILNGNTAFNTDTLFVDSVNGRVGVGTTSPVSRFSVVTTANTAQWVMRGSTIGISNESGLYVDANNDMYFDARKSTGTIGFSFKANGTSFINTGNSLVIGSAGADGARALLDIRGSTIETSTFTASITGTTLDVTAVTNGTIAVGDIVYSSTVAPLTRITALGTGTGGIGTYTVSISQTVSSSTMRSTPRTASGVSISNSDAAELAGQPTGMISFFGSDISTPGAGVYSYIAAVAESSFPDTSLIFGTRNDTDGGVDATERMRIASNGNIGIGNSAPTSTLHVTGTASISGNAVVNGTMSISTGEITSGTYTPTLTGVSNIASSNPAGCYYMRVGNVVTVSGAIAISTTSANANSEIGISLPITSAFTAFNHCAGMGSSIVASESQESATISADSTNDRAKMVFKPSTTATRNYAIHFTYIIL